MVLDTAKISDGDVNSMENGVQTSFNELPSDVLSSILSSVILEPKDAAAISMVNTRLRRAIKSAPLRLRIPDISLISTCEQFPTISHIDLSHLPITDESVTYILNSLPSLTALHLNGCKKITFKSVHAVITKQSIQSISLQRCFQLQHSSLTDLIHASSTPHSKRISLALSHLDLSQWKDNNNNNNNHLLLPPLPSRCVLSQSIPSTLKILALHNCNKLTLHGLQAITKLCPLLHALCLGGCTLELVNDDDNDSSISFLPMISNTIHNSNNSSINNGDSNEGIITTSILTRNSSNSSNTSTSSSDPEDDGHCHHRSIPRLDWNIILTDDAFQHITNTNTTNTNSNINTNSNNTSLYYATSDSNYIWSKRTAHVLYNAIQTLHHLQIIELSFCAPRVLHFLKNMLNDNNSNEVLVMNTMNTSNITNTNNYTPFVWDFCNPVDVHHATSWRTHAMHAGTLSTHDIDIMLHASSRCSSLGRVTPLHVAAETGNLSHVDHLLSLGAHITSRDRSGASPLFTASEAGHATVVARLLLAGADPTARNAAGEAPLYIAALRGHSHVVDVLLSHCIEHGIAWQDPSLYGDGWTPLHAAAVSGRLAIVKQILTAATQESPSSAAHLVCATNRYCQTSLHVAARKGSATLLQVLIDAGGKRALSLQDCDGRTAADVAKRNGNAAVWKMLTLHSSCTTTTGHHHHLNSRNSNRNSSGGGNSNSNSNNSNSNNSNSKNTCHHSGRQGVSATMHYTTTKNNMKNKTVTPIITSNSDDGSSSVQSSAHSSDDDSHTTAVDTDRMIPLIVDDGAKPRWVGRRLQQRRMMVMVQENSSTGDNDCL